MDYDFNLSAILTDDYRNLIVTGIYLTFLLFFACWLLAFALGGLLAVIAGSRSAFLRAGAATYVAYHRNVPILVQLMLWYFAVPQLLPEFITNAINSINAEFVYATITLSLCSAAYISENLRSGLRAIPKTQFEASRAMGFTSLQTMRWIIIPQAWRLSLPALVNDTLGLFKGTAIAAVIGVGELTYQTRLIESETFRIFEVFLVVSCIYFPVTIPLMILGAYTSRRTALYMK